MPALKLNKDKTEAELNRDMDLVREYMHNRQWIRTTCCNQIFDRSQEDFHVRITVNEPPNDTIDQIICPDCETT